MKRRQGPGRGTGPRKGEDGMALLRIGDIRLREKFTTAGTLKQRVDYIMDPAKTEGGTLISTYECEPAFVVSRFLMTKMKYRTMNNPHSKKDVIAYSAWQAFMPGEVTPEEAHRIGRAFAEEALKGRYAFVVCTHTDHPHIHNHIIWNANTLDGTEKFRSTRAVFREMWEVSDRLCRERNLSVQPHGRRRQSLDKEWWRKCYEPTQRVRLRQAIDRALQTGPADMVDLIRRLEAAGYESTEKKGLGFRLAGRRRFNRLRDLGEGYGEEDLLAVMKGEKKHVPYVDRFARKPTLASRIMDRLRSAGLCRNAVKLKPDDLLRVVGTTDFLEKNGYRDLHLLDMAVKGAEARTVRTRSKVAETEAGLDRIQAVMAHAGDLRRTEKIWQAYRKAEKPERVLAEHEAEIRLYRAARKALDEMGLKTVPDEEKLSEQYAGLVKEKEAAGREYRRAKADWQELVNHRENVLTVLGRDASREPGRDDKEREQERKGPVADRTDGR